MNGRRDRVFGLDIGIRDEIVRLLSRSERKPLIEVPIDNLTADACGIAGQLKLRFEHTAPECVAGPGNFGWVEYTRSGFAGSIRTAFNLEVFRRLL